MMNKTIKLFLFILLFYSCSEKTKSPVEYVDPFICTQGDHGHWLPAALVPFGLVELCPDTYPGSLTGDGDFAHSGYDYSDSQIRGISHFHKGSSGGTAIVDRSGLLSFIPFSEMPADSFWQNPVLDIDKKTETAKPGYYSVLLNRENIKVELTATEHGGFHRYTYPEGKTVRLFIYEGNRNRSSGLSLHFPDKQTIEGVQPCYGGIYFVMKFNSEVTSVKNRDGNNFVNSENPEGELQGDLICEFEGLSNSPLEARVGVSLTSIDAARRNLESESHGLSFDQIKENASGQWNEKLSGIIVEGNEEYKTIFYTALYHTCFLPQLTSDFDGTYPGLDQKNHKAEGYMHYDNYAFWDDFRTKFPLYSLWQPQVYSDVVKSLRDIYYQADNWSISPENNHTPHQGDGFRPSGMNGFQAFNTCRHEHMLMVITDAYFKGLFDINLDSVYPYIRNEAMVQMPEKYDQIGYIPARPDQTGEFCWDSWCVAQLAKETGNETDYNYFMNRAGYWKNTWDPAIRYFRARAADGTWLDFPEDPAMNREKYTYEGSKWHWRWNVIHDVPSLIEIFGGEEAFLKELEYFFDNDLYTAGNQIDLQAPFLFNFAGAPWLSQKWTYKILTEPIVQKYGTHDFFPEPIYDRVYKATPDGYLEEMDCDYGCMAAWFNMGAMGLFEVCPGNPVYQITSPIFDKITIQLDPKFYSGKTFTIRANNLSKENYYIQSATLNGHPLDRSWITHDEIVKGGELVYEMGSEANTSWGIRSSEKK